MNLKDKIKPSIPKYTIPQVVAELLESVTIIHKFHLKSKSYAEHIALGSFYDEVGGLADTLFETFAWENSNIEIPNPTLNDSTAINYLIKLATFVEQSRLSTTMSDLQNQLDEVKTLIFSTLYKLKNLK
jgi:hypothetical protein